MKLKKMVSVFLLLVMVMASSFSAFAAEEEVFEYDGIKFTVAGRVTIGEKERGSTNLTLGEGLLITGFYGDGRACAHAITRTFNGEKHHLTAQTICYDTLGKYTASPLAGASNATNVMSGLVSPKETSGGLFIGNFLIISSVTGQRYESSIHTEM